MSPLTFPLSVSSLGLPGASLDEMLRVARDGGCQGLELRAREGEPIHVGLSPDERAAVGSRIAAAGLVTATVASYVEIAAPGRDEDVCDALRAHIELAHDLGAPAVRVFAGGDPEEMEAADAHAQVRLRAVAAEAAAARVRVLVETHDSHPRGADLARILPGTGAGAIWDVVHTWRAGESLADSGRILAPWLAEIQVKDIGSRDSLTPALTGTGVVPLDELVDALPDGFAGWLCLEWERAWHPQIPPAEEALAATQEWLASVGIACGLRRTPAPS